MDRNVRRGNPLKNFNSTLNAAEVGQLQLAYKSVVKFSHWIGSFSHQENDNLIKQGTDKRDFVVK